MEKAVLDTFEASLGRCTASPRFLDRFYENFLASSPKVKEKFAGTDFVHQKRALRGSFHLMLLVADNERSDPGRYLRDLAAQHGKRQMDINADLYDLWLDSLIATVREIDPEFTPEVEDAWERVMMVGIHYMLSHYDDPPKLTIYG